MTAETVRRVRVEGSRNLVEAARAHGVSRIVLGSGYWVYAGSSRPITEDSPVEPAGESRNNFDAERVVLEEGRAEGLETVVVRPAMVYGDGAWFRPVHDGLRDGSYTVIEEGRNRWSFVSLEDTARAFAAVVRLGRPGEVYNVADGDPRAWGEFARWVAQRVGGPAPRSISRAQAEESFDPVVVRHLLAERPMTGEKLRGLGWRPRFSRVEDGLVPLLPTMRGKPFPR